jgi:hypothetical protein
MGHTSQSLAINSNAQMLHSLEYKRRAPSFPKAPFIFDGGKPNSVGVIAHADDHLSHPNFSERPTGLRLS